MLHHFLSFLSFALILSLCTAQLLPICNQLEVCYAIDNFHDTNPKLYRNIIRSLPFISRSLSSTFVKAQFYASGLVKGKLRARYLKPNDRLTDFFGGVGNPFVRKLSSNATLNEPVRTCAVHLRGKTHPRAMIIVTDKFVSVSYVKGIMRLFYTFNLVATSNGLRTDTFNQLRREPRLSKYEKGTIFSSLIRFFTRYLETLAQRKCRIRPKVEAVTEKKVPFISNTEATKDLVKSLLKKPFGKPKVPIRQNLLPFSANDTHAENAVILRNSLETIMYDLVRRRTRRNIGIKSAVGITEIADFNVPFSGKLSVASRMMEEEIIKNSCHAQQCSAKVVVASTEELQWKLVNEAIAILKERDGFKDAFRDSLTNIWKKPLTWRRNWWEVNFKYNRPQNDNR